MEFNTLLLVLALAGLAVLGWAMWIRQGKAGRGDDTVRLIADMQQEVKLLHATLQGQVTELTRQMNAQWQQHAQLLQETQEGYTRTVGQVQHRLGQLHEATQSMVDIGKDIASLQSILQAPKSRGSLGEFFLEELLKQMLPLDHFSLQYTFQSGAMVDAVIFLGQGMIPVDAKFPLENFKRILEAKDGEEEKQARKSFNQDVKKHIDAIASKYILPEENTFEFALMYIPAENVYYEVIIKDEMQTESVASYAQRKRVIPVSPNSFYAYLQAIVRGLKGLRIERSAQMILECLGQLETDFQKFFADFEKIGGHLSNAHSAFDKAHKRFEKLQHKLTSIEQIQNSPAESLPYKEATSSGASQE